MKSRRPIPPHRVLLDDDIELAFPDAWRLTYGNVDADVGNGSVVTSWEVGLGIQARNTIQIRESAGERLGASSKDLKIGVVAVSRTSQGLHSISMLRTPLLIGDSATPLELSFDGHSIAKDVSIHLCVVLLEASNKGDRVSPKEAGARLWSSDWRARVEGGKARLAIEAVDFKQLFVGTRSVDGLLHVIVSEDPSTDVEQGLTVLLNSLQEGFVAAVSRKEPQATALLWDSIVRRVIMLGAEYEYSLADSYPEGSIGEQWKAWVKGAFPRKPLEEVVDLYCSNPSLFDVRIQGWIQMGRAFSGEMGK